VDPHDPSQSVLSRELPSRLALLAVPGTLILLTGLAFWAAVPVGIVWLVRRARRLDTAGEGGQPLEVVDTQYRDTAALAWVMALTGAAATGLFAAFDEFTWPHWGWALGLLPLALMLGWAVRCTARYFRRGRPVLELPEAPIEPGTAVDGRIRLRQQLDPEACRAVLTLRIAGKRPTRARRRTVFEQEVKVSAAAGADGKGTALSVAIEVPARYPESAGQNVRWPAWKLTVREQRAEGRSVDHADFRLPVAALPECGADSPRGDTAPEEGAET
jgi:hypothetical protein